ncbi:hypothetical protein ANN_13209 [Periplaneta americana]|uniref:Reverse transcriptase domain-containing protein n=1 Tax=Periplaneta americana TaxID=6978 RepID=A0ABQ8TJR5_PERAM|nr:hypothetical protein ANN_13209 [Periplaneta americana]
MDSPEDRIDQDTEFSSLRNRSGDAAEITSTPCPYCGKLYVRVSTHITKSHPDKHTERVVQRHVSKSQIINEIGNENSNHKQSSPDDNSVHLQKLRNQVRPFESKFAELLGKQPCLEDFNLLYNEFIMVLLEIGNKLPGPKHPACCYFEMRQHKRIFKSNDRTYAKTSNPEKLSKRDIKKRREKYNYDLLQYQYYNERKKCVWSILNNIIPIGTLKEALEKKWGTSNNTILDNYNMTYANTQQDDLDQMFQISVQDIQRALNGMKADSAAGPDQVLIRTLKLIDCASIIKKILEIMMDWNVVPDGMRDARTILIYKGKGERCNPSNWRPISICSAVRRLIERVIDVKMRQFVLLNENQRGFVSQPDTYINISLVDGCLQHAKQDKKDLNIVMLDMTQAFDNVGFEHLEQTLNTQPLPTRLRELIKTLTKGNFTTIHSSGSKSDRIELKRGVFQGSPLSPLLFNLSIDFIIKELTEKHIIDQYGFQINSDLDSLTISAFADDIVVIGKSMNAAQELIMMVTSLLQNIGLQLNVQKSASINIHKGKLLEKDLFLHHDSYIKAIGPEDTIKYLGITFNDELQFNSEELIVSLRQDL